MESKEKIEYKSPLSEGANPLKVILGASKTIFWILLFLYLLFNGLDLFIQTDHNLNLDKDYSRIFSGLGETIVSLGREVYVFLKPFLQLALILLLIDWLLKKLGVNFGSSSFKLEWNVQSLIAIIIISGFTIAALAGVGYADSLKDLALVVVGFYFGSQKLFTDITRGEEKIVTTEEHDNPKLE